MPCKCIRTPSLESRLVAVKSAVDTSPFNLGQGSPTSPIQLNRLKAQSNWDRERPDRIAIESTSESPISIADLNRRLPRPVDLGTTLI
jgi:hypothetical protein